MLSDVLDDFPDKLPSPEVTFLSEKLKLRPKKKKKSMSLCCWFMKLGERWLKMLTFDYL